MKATEGIIKTLNNKKEITDYIGTLTGKEILYAVRTESMLIVISSKIQFNKISSMFKDAPQGKLTPYNYTWYL